MNAFEEQSKEKDYEEHVRKGIRKRVCIESDGRACESNGGSM